MGRTSKRKAAGALVRPAAREKVYKAGIYARLSSHKEYRACGQAPKKESVEVQIKIAKKYVEEFNQKKNGERIEVVEYYTDLGKTGSNFNRDGFARLLQDIRLGEINCVIVKDLSRFGRNYLEAGNYIEKIFPFLGVRFIAVADGYDTGEDGNDSRQMASEIKNLVNDMYAKDFSRKGKLHLRQRREMGSYVGGPPPYGYTAGWDGKRRVLVPDENTAPLVRLIYEKYVELENAAAVADELNRGKVNPPAVYKKTGEAYCDPKEPGYKGWNRGAVERILGSETYVGRLVQGKTSITARDERNRMHKPEGEWTVSEDAHEPLVDAGLYRQAQAVREKIRARTAARNHPSRDCPIGENIFENVLCCGVCGGKMTRSSYVKRCADGRKARMEGYFCPKAGGTKDTTCQTPNRISRLELVGVLVPLVRMEFAVHLDGAARFLKYGREQIAQAEKKAAGAIRETEKRICRLREEEGQVYMDYRAGKLPRQEYADYERKQEGRLADVEKQKELLEKKRKELEKFSGEYLAAVKALVGFRSAGVLTREMAGAFFTKVYVYPGKRLEVTFAFRPGGMKEGG